MNECVCVFYERKAILLAGTVPIAGACSICNVLLAVGVQVSNMTGEFSKSGFLQLSEQT